MNMLTPLHIRLLQYAADHNMSGLRLLETDETYTATRELLYGGYLTVMHTPFTAYYVTPKGLDYLKALALREKWNTAVSGKGGQS